MRPTSIRWAAWLFGTAMLIENIVLPGARLMLNALHPQSRGESPLLSIMAMGVGFVLIFPRLLIGGIALFNIVKRRNWARVLALMLIVLSLFGAFQTFSLALAISGFSGALWWLLYQGIGPLLYASSAVLLYSKESNEWFSDKET